MSQNSTASAKTCNYCEKMVGSTGVFAMTTAGIPTIEMNGQIKKFRSINTPEIFRIIKRNYEILKRNSKSYGKR